MQRPPPPVITVTPSLDNVACLQLCELPGGETSDLEVSSHGEEGGQIGRPVFSFLVVTVQTKSSPGLG